MGLFSTTEGSFMWSAYLEAVVCALFNFGTTAAFGVAEVLKRLYFPKADIMAVVGSLILGWLTIFSLLDIAVVNPAVGLVFWCHGKLHSWRFLFFICVQVLVTLLAVTAVAAMFLQVPIFKGIAAPAPPTLGGDIGPLHIFASEAAITFSVLAVGGLAADRMGRLQAAVVSSAFYCAIAYYEAGVYSGAIMNPAGILALTLYDKELTDAKVWAEAAPALAPYVAGPLVGALLLGLATAPPAKIKTRARPSAAAASRRAKKDS